MASIVYVGLAVTPDARGTITTATFGNRDWQEFLATDKGVAGARTCIRYHMWVTSRAHLDRDCRFHLTDTTLEPLLDPIYQTAGE